MPRPPGWVESEARGPMIGITVGDTIRLRVEREDFPLNASLFVTASAGGAPQFKIAEPEGGGALPSDGVFRVEALEDNDTAQTIEIRLGSTEGPILAEAEPHVFEPLTLRVVPHLCTIHSSASGGSGKTPEVQLSRWFAEARSILRPAGIHLRLDGMTRQSYLGFNRDDLPRRPSGTFSGNEEATLVSQGYVENRCNVWFMRYMEDSKGIGVNRDNMGSEGFENPGVLIAVDGQWSATQGVEVTDAASRDQVVANDLAHEIGHFLGLSHAGQDYADDPYHQRNLMHSRNPLSEDVDAGYGPKMRGALVTLKVYPNEEGDGQAARLRDRLRQPNTAKY